MQRALFATALIAAGCGDLPQPAPSVVSLNTPVRITAATDGSVAPSTAVRVHVTGGVGPQESAVELTLRGLTVALTSDGEHATLEAFDLPLADIDIPAEALPPHGLALRSLRLWAPVTHAQVLRAERDTLEVRATLALKFSWAMLLDDGTRWSLGPVATPPLPITVTVARSADGVTTLQASATCAGVCWAVDELVRMSDLSLQLESAATVDAAR